MADPNTKGDQAMPDTKYLQKRDGCWYRPPQESLRQRHSRYRELPLHHLSKP